MKILIDALSARNGGGQTYLINLLDNIPKDLEIFLIKDYSLKIDEKNNLTIIDSKVSNNPFIRNIWQKRNISRIIKDYEIDMVFFPGGVVPSVNFPIKVVTMFRNMLPLDEKNLKRFPISFNKVRLKILSYKLLKSMEVADAVIFISKYAQQVVFGKSSKILNSTIIEHGISNAFRVTSISQNDKIILKKHKINTDYFLYVSTLNFYKNQIEVIKAFYQYKKKYSITTKLVLVGHKNTSYEKKLVKLIKQLNLDDEVILTGSIDYKEIVTLNRNAELIIFASTCENCPNILLESMAIGKPLLVSNVQPMPEFAGVNAIFFDPYDSNNLFDKLVYFSNNKKDMQLNGLGLAKHSEKYNWIDTSNRTWEYLVQLNEKKEVVKL